MEDEKKLSSRTLSYGLKGLRLLIFIIPAVALFLFVAYFSFNKMMKALVHQKGEIVVPDILGKSISEAMKFTSEKDIFIKLTGEQHNERIPPGSIISQQPPPGMIVRKGKVVKVIVSSGGKMVYVPDITGKSLRETELVLRQEGLVMGQETMVYSNTVMKNFVVAQDPEAGEIVNKGAIVNIVVSQGPTSLVEFPIMPNLIGQNIKKVKNIIEESGFLLGEIKWIINDSLTEGTVIKQSPLPGEMLPGEEITVKLVLSQRSKKESVLREEVIYYELPQSGLEREVVIVIKDLQGEREVYRRTHSPGSKISCPVQFLGPSRSRIYIDEVLVEEKEYD